MLFLLSPPNRKKDGKRGERREREEREGEREREKKVRGMGSKFGQR